MGIAADFVLIVLAGLAGGILARLLRLPLLVGYVAAGVVVGPNTAGPTVTQIRDIELLAEVGVALLLFSLGLEISISNLAKVRRIAVAGGSIQLLVTSLAAAWAAVALLGVSWSAGSWFGAIVSLSSTMVVLKTLAARGVTNTLASSVMIGLLVMQDLAVIPMLVILPQLDQPDNLLQQLGKSMAMAAVILAGTVVAGVKVLPPLLQRILKWGSRELFLVAVVAVAVGVGYALHAAGLSFALGAFIAGIIVSEAEFSHLAFEQIEPLRDIFGLLFFVSVGMLFDPAFVARNSGLIAGTFLLVLLGKALIFGALTRAFGYRYHAPWIVGLGLAQIGEFSFVLAREGLRTNAFSRDLYDLILTVTVLTMAVSPVLSSLALPLARRAQDVFVRPEPVPPAGPQPG